MKVILFTGAFLVAGIVTAAVRPPAVAGAFYPSSPQRLRQQVEALLAAAPAVEAPAAVVVVPHAGYGYSGATAARGFAALRQARVRRIILLGPSHHAAFSGGALPDVSTSAFRTPLGDMPLDRAALRALRGSSDFDGPAASHLPEHCLEVEVPFLQVVAPGSRLVPVLVGLETDRGCSRRMARRLAALLDDETAVVVSTDFTHHGSGYGWAPFPVDRDLADTLLGLGRATAQRVAEKDPDGFWHQVEVSGDTVCGRRPLAVLTEMLAHAFDGRGRVVDVTTSGHVSRTWDRVVTYAAITFEGSWHGWREERGVSSESMLSQRDGSCLLELARAALRSHLAHDASLAKWFDAHGSSGALRRPAGAFVTLHNTGERVRKEGRLRACMGVMDATEPMVDAVIHAAMSASRDPRFPRLELDELHDLSLEVSILSPTRRVDGPEAIEIGHHGVVLSRSGRRAVFLPQVATEQGWDRETMLAQLSRKAGLDGDAWRSGATFEVFTADVFSEEE